MNITLNDDEQRYAEQLWLIYDQFLRIHSYPENLHYQWEKAGSLANAASTLHDMYRFPILDENEEPVDDLTTYVAPRNVDTAKVSAWIAQRARAQHPSSLVLFPEDAL